MPYAGREAHFCLCRDLAASWVWGGKPITNGHCLTSPQSSAESLSPEKYKDVQHVKCRIIEVMSVVCCLCDSTDRQTCSLQKQDYCQHVGVTYKFNLLPDHTSVQASPDDNWANVPNPLSWNQANIITSKPHLELHTPGWTNETTLMMYCMACPSSQAGRSRDRPSTPTGPGAHAAPRQPSLQQTWGYKRQQQTVTQRGSRSLLFDSLLDESNTPQNPALALYQRATE